MDRGVDNIRHPHVEECENAFLSAVFLIYPKVPVTVISGGWKEQFFWLPAHLIHLTLKKTERLWQTGQRKIVP